MILQGTGRPSKYLLKDGTQVHGTTTILGRFKESGGLLQWAFQQGRSGAASLYEQRDKARDVGSHIHAMVQADIHGQSLPEMPIDFTVVQMKQAESGFYAWLRWRQDRNIEIVATEVPLVSEKHRYGGTLDAIWRNSGGLCMGDWKSANGVYIDNLMQLGAYKVLWEENYPDQPITGGYDLARFSKQHGDFEHRHWDNLDDAIEEFLLLVRAYEIDKRLKTRV